MASTFKISQDGKTEGYSFTFFIDTYNTNILIKEYHIYGNIEGLTISCTQRNQRSIEVNIKSDNVIIHNPTEIPVTITIDFENTMNGDTLLVQFIDSSITIIDSWTDNAILECVNVSNADPSVIMYELSCLKERNPPYLHPTIRFKKNGFDDIIVLPVEILPYDASFQ